MLGSWEGVLPGTEPNEVYTDMDQWISVRRACGPVQAYRFGSHARTTESGYKKWKISRP